MNKIIGNYNHQLNQNLIKKAINDTEDWYSEEVKKSNIEFLNWLCERKENGL